MPLSKQWMVSAYRYCRLDQTVYVGETVYFNGTKSYDPDGYITSYQWDFSDTNSATGVKPSNVYTMPGVYYVSFTVTDNDGDVETNILIIMAKIKGLDCLEFEGKVTQLTLQYNGDVAANITVDQKKEGIVFNENVDIGAQFTIIGTDNHGTLGTEISIYKDGIFNTKIHTSCSKPIGPGLVSGDFEVIKGYSRKGGLLCPNQ